MSQTIYRCGQLTPEWWTVRRGIPTASAFDKIITPAKGDLSKSCKKYIWQLLAEINCLSPNYFSVNGVARPSVAMQNGLDTEPEARRWYEMEADCTVEQIGFLVSSCGRWGCSPDGLIGPDGGQELKCPNLETQYGYLDEGVLPDEYKPQVHGTLVCTERKWWDFVSYAPPAPGFRIRVFPDEYTEKVRKALINFSEAFEEAKRKFDVIWPTYDHVLECERILNGATL